MRGVADAPSAVDGDADIAASAEGGLAGVQTEPDERPCAARPILLEKRSDAFDGGGESVRRDWEHSEDRISLKIDDGATRCIDSTLDKSPMPLK